jgi:hypothetical protein
MDGPAVPDENAVGSAVVAAEYVYRTPCDVPKTCVVYRVPMFAVVANRFVVVTEFAAYRLFESERLDRFETCQTFRVPTFAVVANRFVVVTELDTTRFANGWVIALLEMLLKRPPSP